LVRIEAGKDYYWTSPEMTLNLGCPSNVLSFGTDLSTSNTKEIYVKGTSTKVYYWNLPTVNSNASWCSVNKYASF